jgi:NtrC-family two-component system sensor histidine kinase KinB
VTLRAKLVLAQAPLAVALVFVGLVSGTVTTRLGTQSRLILADNYRSVLAAQRMKDALDALDAQALLVLSGRGEAVQQAAAARRTFGGELAVQEGNITESGEKEVTRTLRAGWDEYVRALQDFDAASGRSARENIYFSRLRPALERINAAADHILDINQDAMVRKSDRAARRATELERVVVAVVFLGLTLGLLASAWLTTRLLRPLGVVTAAVRRFGEGDLRARADVRGADEISAVAAEFNRMAERLERYRASSLGELLQAQQAAQAAIDSLPDPVLLLDADGAPTNSSASIPSAVHRRSTRAPIRPCARCSTGSRCTCSAAREPTCRRGSRRRFG